jgi:ABC-2 type transport system ATP-binding protein
VAVIAGGLIVAEGPPDSLGGRDHAEVHIRFSLPDGVSPADLPLPVSTDGVGVLIETAEPTRTLAALTAWAVDRSLELPGLTVTRPTLEDVYLELAGDP